MPTIAWSRPRTRLAAALLVAATAAWIAPAPLAAQPATIANSDEILSDAAWIRANYTKFEARVPMRDGVRLFTAVYVPNDRSQKYPILMHRTPYGSKPYGAAEYRELLGPSKRFAYDGFIFVYQDVRGAYMSEGTFVDMRPHVEGKRGPQDVDESTDTYDTIDWLLAHVPGNNGRVGQWGISYPGFYTAAGMIDSHPALRAVSPQAPISDWFFDDFHHHGAFFLPHAFNFFAGFGQPRPELTTERPGWFEGHGTPDGYDFFLHLGPLADIDQEVLGEEIAFWNQIAEHPNYDEFWQARNLLPHLKGVGCAVLTVGGWYDAEDLYGPLAIYRKVEAANPGIFNALVMGPWFHTAWSRPGEGRQLGDADFGFSTSDWFQEHVELPFFLHYLKGQGDADIAEATMFETGANRWRRFPAWPPPGLVQHQLYLQAGGGLALDTPPTAACCDEVAAGNADEVADPGYDQFISDPARPVPFADVVSPDMVRPYPTADQRFAARRPDVLVYQTEPLTDDLTLAGPITAELWVSTSRNDADWVVKVIDVYPGDAPDPEPNPREVRMGGYQMMVRSEVIRGRFRDSYEHPTPFTPDQPTRVVLPLQDLLHTFRRGHRVMVQIQSTWFPMVDRNPQRWVDNIFLAEPGDYAAATHRVYRTPELPTRLTVGVLPAAGGP